MTFFLTILHVVVCIFLILVVLLQAGKGGGMGIAFGGGGGSQTVFGSSGAGNFLTRLTSVTAGIFMITSLGLAHYSSQQDSKRLQQLAERKATEKKAEDERAAKLKTDLEKALQSAKPGAAGAPGVQVLPPGATPEQIKTVPTPGPDNKASETPAKGAKDTETSGKAAKPAKTDTKTDTKTDGAGKDQSAPAEAPKKRKRAPKTETTPGAEAPAAPAPAAPPAE